MDEKEDKDPGETIMAAICSLNTCQFSDLMRSVASEFRRRHHHLCFLLCSSTRFTQTLFHLQTISLRHKALLIARYLLSTLTLLTRFLVTSTTSSSLKLSLTELEAALLLMLLCEVHQQEPKALQGSPAEWHTILKDYILRSSLLTMAAGLGGESSSAVFTSYIDLTVKCRRFLDAAGCGDEVVREVAASVAAVVALPSVEKSGRLECCAICREAMKEGEEMRRLPCEHIFHWMCVLPWLKKRNTCPCCRFQLPTDDVFGEIQRLWSILLLTKS